MTRSLAILLILLQYSIICTAQDVSSDTLKVDNWLSEAVKLNLSGNTDSAYSMALKALNRSVEMNYRPGKAGSYELLGDIDKEAGMLAIALRNYFSALREFEWLNDVKAMVNININIGDAYYVGELYSKATEYYVKAIKLSSTDPNLINQDYVNLMLGNCYSSMGDHKNALIYYKKLYSDLSASEKMPVITKIIFCYQKLNYHDSAMIYNRSALELFENNKDVKGKAYALNNIGYNYKYLGDLEAASISFQEALRLFKESGSDEDEYLVSLVNLGVVHQNSGNYEEAIACFFQGLEIASKAGDNFEIAQISHLLAESYFLQKDFYNALQYAGQALNSARASSDPQTEASILFTLSKINTAFYDYELALEQYREYLQIRDSILFEQRLKGQEYLKMEFEVERTEREIEQFVTSREIQEMARRELALDTLKKHQQIEIQQKTIELKDAALTNQQLQQARAEQARMLAEERLAAEIKDREILELKITEQLQQDSIEEIDYQRKLVESDNELLRKDNELQLQSLQRIKARNRFLAGIFLLALMLVILLIIGLRFARKTNRKLKDQRNKIQQQKEAIQSQYEIIDRERQKSDKLLLNILPEETAAELKENGRATPKHYDQVTVLFTDFVGFTNIAEKLTPEEVIVELDNCFLEFDHISDKYNLEKIKTIGDSYMCAGGIPVSNTTNPADAVSAALEIRDFMQKLKEDKESRGEPFWELRIGINTGPVIAGVVGKNKFAYDIWGDAVNIASRMESSGEAGKVNISGDTYELVKDWFNCSYRGKVKAKNKGEIDMYFVDRKKK